MTDKEQKDGTGRATILAHVATPFVGADGKIVDPLDDAALDALLEAAVPEASEPRLVLVDRLLTRLRFRREV